MDTEEFLEALSLIKEDSRRYRAPVVSELVSVKRDPFLVLVSCLLSLRTKDEVTRQAQERLFSIALTPEGIASLPAERIEGAIYPVGFYRTKARTLKDVSAVLLEKYGGRVPDDLPGLLSLKGVGRKTANLVLTMGFGKPGICVDTHVHRIVNRLGYVRTRSPEHTETALRERLPIEHWMEINDLLVTWGQNVCRPVSPFCSSCSVSGLCGKVDVKRSR